MPGPTEAETPEARAAVDRSGAGDGPRVGVLLWSDAQGPSDISGMPSNMRDALARAGCQVVPVPIGDRLRSGRDRRPRPRSWSQLLAIARCCYEDRWPARAHRKLVQSAVAAARRAQAATAGLELDAVFAPLMSHALAFYEGPHPVVYATDSTATLLNHAYARFRRRGAGWRSAEIELETRAIARADRVVVASEHVRRSAILDHDAAADRVEVVPMGANIASPPTSPPAATPPSRDDLRLLFVAQDPERKRLDLCLEITRELRRRGWGAKLHFVGPRRAACKQLEVTWEGYLSRDDAAHVQKHHQLMRDCHVALLPSAAEMYGIAPVESAAFGRPAVVSGVGGLPTVVLDGVSGRVVPVDAEVAVWADAVEHVAADPQRYAEYGRAARARFDETLNWDAWGRALRAVIEDLR